MATQALENAVAPVNLIPSFFSPVILVLLLRHLVYKGLIAKDEDIGQPPTPEVVSPDLISDKGGIGCRLTKLFILLFLGDDFVVFINRGGLATDLLYEPLRIATCDDLVLTAE